MSDTPWTVDTGWTTDKKLLAQHVPRRPATCMTWSGATKFCDAVSERLHHSGAIDQTWRLRLPMGAEWEYACRAGTTTKFNFGDKAQDDATKKRLADPYVWDLLLHEVGLKKPNAWGLFDMHGHVSELCFNATTWSEDKKAWIPETSVGTY